MADGNALKQSGARWRHADTGPCFGWTHAVHPPAGLSLEPTVPHPDERMPGTGPHTALGWLGTAWAFPRWRAQGTLIVLATGFPAPSVTVFATAIVSPDATVAPLPRSIWSSVLLSQFAASPEPPNV